MSSNENGPNKENVDPNATIQPMPNARYVAGSSQFAMIALVPGGVRDRGIIVTERERIFTYQRARILYLTRFMEETPFPGRPVHSKSTKLSWPRLQCK